MSSKRLPFLSDDRLVRISAGSPDVRGFISWARFPYEEIEETASGRTVYLLDARYTRIRSADFGTERVEVTKD